MPREHAPFQNQGGEHAPFLQIGGGGGGGEPTGPAGGSLSGTYPNPGIANAVVGKPQLTAEVNELLGKSGPPTGAAGGVLTGEYPNPSLKAEGVTTAAIKLLAIVTALLGEESVTTQKIKLLAITTALLAGESVTAEKLANESVTTEKLKLLAVTKAILGEESVGEEKLTAAIRAILNGAMQRAGKYKLARESIAAATPRQAPATKGLWIIASFGNTGKTTAIEFEVLWGETSEVVTIILATAAYTPKTTTEVRDITFYVPPGTWWQWKASEAVGTFVVQQIEV